ncbi:transmembrane protease serine 9-like [Eurosta solidaginis]|uniref:transmembrane protease serine 9-like n=1 Tax=Eurosta solidaginis TaxID=178769 RepID=UPI003530F776
MWPTLNIALLVITFAIFGTSHAIVPPAGRILGGEGAATGQFTFAASVRLDSAHVCGGNIIGTRQILTAAHCLVDNKKYVVNTNRISVRVGSVNQFAGGKIVYVDTIALHPAYERPTNDIAVLTLITELEVSSKLSIIALAKSIEEEPPVGSEVVVAGWGEQFSGMTPYKLQSTKFTVATDESCTNGYAANDETMFCLAHSLKQGTCTGDAGNGAIYNNRLVGISSFVVGNCGSRYPDVFVNISVFAAWIESQIELVATRSKVTALILIYHLCLNYCHNWRHNHVLSERGNSFRLCTLISKVAEIMLVRSAITLTILWLANAAPNERVVGGFDAYISQFPYQISLQHLDGSHSCGGSIISNKFILTAAHCVVVGNGIETYPPRFYQVRVGSVQRAAGGQLLNVKRIIVNKSYGNFLNDIALLELEEPLEFTKNIQPIEIADEEVPSGEDVIISGWGTLTTFGYLPHRLQWNTLKALTTEECEDAIKMGVDSFICLAHQSGNGACNGDSGGPANYKGKLVGVAGFVINGCGSNKPDGYAKVFYHRDWIKAHIGE